MLAFAANSLLCRLALVEPRIDPASFGLLRLASGALVLTLIVRSRAGVGTTAARHAIDWLAAMMLFAYVALFSFAYLSLSASVGALILFGAVQLTMIAAGLRAGERFAPAAWAGLAMAVVGLVYLVSPGLTAPSAAGAASMALAGAAWGVYSLRGRGVVDALAATASNFARAVLPALVLSLATIGYAAADGVGIALAIASGALTSGIGYVIWYSALRGLTAMRAASVQLSVPPIAALGGVLVLSEPLTSRLVIASAAILGGIAVVLLVRARSVKR
ncbi:MAG: DMT family transporter [Burkholderiaceae bacterium]|nr:DMT family transporter [Burkholderiaceae bacterium]